MGCSVNTSFASMSIHLFDLSGKTALVTGATQGLGRAIAEGLAKAGAHVLINARNADRLEHCITECRQQGLSVHPALFDVTDNQAVQDAIATVERKQGPIDILVNNAGIIRRARLEDLEEAAWDEVIRTDLTAPFLVSKYVARFMIPRKAGKIINICSLMSEVGRDTVAAYAAAKGGLKMLTRSMATEWARHNIQVNGIGPGFFATPINEIYRAPGNPLNDFILSRTPAGRWGRPEDLIGTAVFLASQASDFVNGQILYVDGGLLATVGKPVGEP